MATDNHQKNIRRMQLIAFILLVLNVSAYFIFGAAGLQVGVVLSIVGVILFIIVLIVQR